MVRIIAIQITRDNNWLQTQRESKLLAWDDVNNETIGSLCGPFKLETKWKWQLFWRVISDTVFHPGLSLCWDHYLLGLDCQRFQAVKNKPSTSPGYIISITAGPTGCDPEQVVLDNPAWVGAGQDDL